MPSNESWDQRNHRRVELIRKKIYEGLTEQEHNELEHLQETMVAELNKKYPLPEVPIDPLDSD